MKVRVIKLKDREAYQVEVSTTGTDWLPLLERGLSSEWNPADSSIATAERLATMEWVDKDKAEAAAEKVARFLYRWIPPSSTTVRSINILEISSGDPLAKP